MSYNMSNGALMICCLIAAFFFQKYYRKSYDNLFKLFAFAFYLLGFERFILGVLGARSEPSPMIYLIRLSAFVLIIYAVVKKNRERTA